MKLNRKGKAVFGLVGTLIALVAVGWLFLFQPFHGAASTTTKVVVIAPGSGLSQIAQKLEQEGVISGSTRFQIRARVSGDVGELQAGQFLMQEGMSYGAALDVLTGRARVKGKYVTIPEGLAREEIAPVVARAGVQGSYLAASKSSPKLNPSQWGAPRGSTLDGFLYPDTYELARPPSATSLVDRQLEEFKRQIATVDMAKARSKNLTTYDVLTIAAMVERETAVAKERPLVAAVIWNRLKAHIPLGIDATTRYQFHNWTRPLLASELASSSPWNTRNRQGLPPGPIGNPGIASIKAAANPASVSYLYYVVKPWTCGEHTFTATQAQFDQAVNAYNAARNGNGGRAPTKCN